jgi:hypothetical protein
MAEDYWGDGYWGLGFWGDGFWGQGGAAPPTVVTRKVGLRYRRPPQPQLNPKLLKLIKQYLELKLEDGSA